MMSMFDEQLTRAIIDDRRASGLRRGGRRPRPRTARALRRIADRLDGHAA